MKFSSSDLCFLLGILALFASAFSLGFSACLCIQKYFPFLL